MYSMALDNSWAIMNEEEMYDVNGGMKFGVITKWWVPTALTVSLTSAEAFNFYAGGLAVIAAISGAALLFWPEKVTAGLLATKITFAASSILSALCWAVSAGKGLFMQINLYSQATFKLI